jgi:oxygen-independent coproporphyrinogen-3 oxidase
VLQTSFHFTTPPPLSLYVHLPWCARKCPYCDFNSHETRGDIPEDDYIAALLADLEQDLPRVWGRTVRTIFIGGGTPSLFSPEAIDRLLSGIHARLMVAPDAEVSLEANPGSVELGRFRGYRAAGVNRLSIGIQSFDADKLKALGRIHGPEEALAAATSARAAGFDNFNLDLMFGLPGQTVEQARADVATAIRLEPTHLSIYQLTLEPNTYFHRYPPLLPDDDTIWAMQEQLQALLAANGYRQYEVSAYARAGSECRHNLNYWRFGDYLGVGAGAHAKLSTADAITRLWKIKQPTAYLEAAGTPAVLGGEQMLTAHDAALEFMLNALRLTEGFATTLFEERTGLSLAEIEVLLRRAQTQGLIVRDERTIQPTERGRRYLNNLLELFL